MISTSFRANMNVNRISSIRRIATRVQAPLRTSHAEVELDSQAVPAPAPVPTPPTIMGPTAPVNINAVMTPADIYKKVVEIGTAKAQLPISKIFVLGCLAGCYVGFGAMIMLSCGCNMPSIAAADPGLAKFITGSFGLPCALTLVLICGAELFTGNTAVVTAAVYEKKATLQQLAKSWTVSLLGNVVGSLLMVYLLTNSGLMAGVAAPIKVAVAKCSLTWGEAFTRGILCNWLVCLAVWMATASSTLGGKFVGVFLPISGFAASGFEHSVANAFIIPFAMALGAPITFSQFLLNNFVPVLLGNVVASVIFVAGAYSAMYGGGQKTAPSAVPAKA